MAYRRAYEFSASGLFKKSCGSPLCGRLMTPSVYIMLHTQQSNLKRHTAGHSRFIQCWLAATCGAAPDVCSDGQAQEPAAHLRLSCALL